MGVGRKHLDVALHIQIAALDHATIQHLEEVVGDRERGGGGRQVARLQKSTKQLPNLTCRRL